MIGGFDMDVFELVKKQAECEVLTPREYAKLVLFGGFNKNEYVQVLDDSGVLVGYLSKSALRVAEMFDDAKN